ncbi:calcium-binding protein [Myxosarcina sp. GI1]|uniref:calcium-binding protein n=1 Tax=Myxosarcina sp. GI1 TaxID=1541065 RepID=UPI000692396A|nr:calcium-binding protein [Myxosarcina sp. GI1]
MVTTIGDNRNNKIIGTKKEDLLRGGDGDDFLKGLKGNDTLIGDRGSDRKFGGKGNDLFVWNNGDGSDINEGGKDYDISRINGADAGDEFELEAKGHQALFQRINLVPFSVDANNVEKFELNGLGGDDTITVKDLSGTDVKQVYIAGGEGNDWLDARYTAVNIKAYGGEGYDTIYGGKGNDWIDGGKGNDWIDGGKGYDKFLIASGNGYDQIKDFEVDKDYISLGGGLSYKDIELTQKYSGTVISADDEKLAFLSSVNADHLSADNFGVIFNSQL